MAAGPARLRLHISGDTLAHSDLREIPQRYPDSDLALLHLGGTRPLGVLLTMDAEQGVPWLRLAWKRTSTSCTRARHIPSRLHS
jgi:hypothetical protein